MVVPCFNEALRLDPKAFLAFDRVAADVEFVFVNDGSVDRTSDVIDRLVADLGSGASALHLKRNGGKAEAVRAGVVHALSRNPFAVGFWDADLSTPLLTIGAFQRVLEQRPRIDMVFGARVALLGREIRRRTRRHYSGRVFATAVSMALDLPIHDSQCGAKLFRVTPILAELFGAPFLSRWIFDVEIVARHIRAARTCGSAPTDQVLYEYPLDSWTDVPGSKLELLDFPKAFVDLLRIRRAYLA